ncbi:hypothetical protein VSX64_19585 [Aurantimonas sp. C2-6-R+9]|uniref:hypothetical protein n=1 Tax=unclassified Aurantimonas TaxID=2638230 RepID=UPI002E184C08|nr:MULTISPECIES: hypothetical protein [unclassified Aurantimonas]MEC5292827.1 hypothetical protein [Aurantimonas sp. C2-3-R2]MEC5383039.1 hypothetical protein [Aurantimonas sp. C2-6-R+9]MEC5413893.1 hypothetical protein [Aurantimonas sp. C2-4-R8]
MIADPRRQFWLSKKAETLLQANVDVTSDQKTPHSLPTLTRCKIEEALAHLSARDKAKDNSE